MSEDRSALPYREVTTSTTPDLREQAELRDAWHGSSLRTWFPRVNDPLCLVRMSPHPGTYRDPVRELHPVPGVSTHAFRRNLPLWTEEERMRVRRFLLQDEQRTRQVLELLREYYTRVRLVPPEEQEGTSSSIVTEKAELHFVDVELSATWSPRQQGLRTLCLDGNDTAYLTRLTLHSEDRFLANGPGYGEDGNIPSLLGAGATHGVRRISVYPSMLHAALEAVWDAWDKPRPVPYHPLREIFQMTLPGVVLEEVQLNFRYGCVRTVVTAT